MTRSALTASASTAGSSVLRTTGRVSRAGLSPKRVVAKHRKRGHDVSSLRDLRRLDLQQIDAVRGRTASWLYPAGAALSGAEAGFVISGGELATAVSGGAAAAPSGAAITGAFIGDAATVLALGSRAVGRTALLYGYDPELRVPVSRPQATRAGRSPLCPPRCGSAALGDVRRRP